MCALRFHFRQNVQLSTQRFGLSTILAVQLVTSVHCNNLLLYLYLRRSLSIFCWRAHRQRSNVRSLRITSVLHVRFSTSVAGANSIIVLLMKQSFHRSAHIDSSNFVLFLECDSKTKIGDVRYFERFEYQHATVETSLRN